MAEALVPQQGKMAIAAINCDDNQTTCKAFKLRGYPTIMLYKKAQKDEPKEIPDDTARTAHGLAEFLVAQTGIKYPFAEPETPVTQLKALNYENILKDKFTLVKFATPWCGFCKRMAPDYEKLALAFSNDEKVSIAEVDCTKQGEICDHYGIQGYPTLKFFDHSLEDSLVYEGGRDLESMVQFVNKQCGLSRKSDGTLLPDYARIPALDNLVLEFMNANKETRSQLMTQVESLLVNAPEYSRFIILFQFFIFYFIGLVVIMRHSCIASWIREKIMFKMNLLVCPALSRLVN